METVKIAVITLARRIAVTVAAAAIVVRIVLVILSVHLFLAPLVMVFLKSQRKKILVPYLH